MNKFLLATFCAVFSLSAFAGELLVANFDRAIKMDWPPEQQFQSAVGKIMNSGVKGGALSLDATECLTTPAPVQMGESGGTVMFWLRPHWGYYAARGDRMISHTMLSWRWKDGGYFALSDGWWEDHGGAFDTYFILNNAQYLHVRAPVKYRAGQWLHMMVSWTPGKYGQMAMYVDGEQVAVRSGEIPKMQPAGSLFLGCDRGSPLQNGRGLDADVDELVVLDHALTATELQAWLTRNDPRWRERPTDWIREFNATQNAPVVTNHGSMKEVRALFDEGPGEWGTEVKARALIARLKSAGFNMYVPCVWHGDGTRYPTTVAPPAPYIAKGDALATLIRVAHEAGIEVHPWFTVSYRSRDFLNEFYEPGTPQDAFEIHNQHFRDYMVRLILDVVKRYDIDGINLDYVRTMGISSGRYATDLYKSRYQRSLDADQRTFDGRLRMEPHVQEFVDDAVADVVRRISEGAHIIKPNIVISVDGQPPPSLLPPSYQGRNEVKWANAGWVDVIFTMHYERNLDADSIDLVASELKDGKKLVPLLGVYERVGGRMVARDPAVFGELVDFASMRWHKGVAVYPASLFGEGAARALEQRWTKRPAVTPWSSDNQSHPN